MAILALPPSLGPDKMIEPPSPPEVPPVTVTWRSVDWKYAAYTETRRWLARSSHPRRQMWRGRLLPPKMKLICAGGRWLEVAPCAVICGAPRAPVSKVEIMTCPPSLQSVTLSPPQSAVPSKVKLPPTTVKVALAAVELLLMVTDPPIPMLNVAFAAFPPKN